MELQWASKIIEGIGGKIAGRTDGTVKGVSIDTRKECEGTIFVALHGERTDGHKFVEEALRKGAKAVVIDGSAAEAAGSLGDSAREVAIFAVRDTLKALQRLAAEYRKLIGPRVVAVTGSTGKTTTKEMIASVLSRRFKVHSTPGNLNNHIGLPVTILGMEGSEDVLVTEMGASAPKEIHALSDIAGPDYGVVTNIGPAHLEFFKTLKGVAKAKAELLEALPRRGKAVLPRDDDFFEFLVSKTAAQYVSFGFSPEADYTISNLERLEGPRGYGFTINETALKIHLYGKHNVLNAACAFAVGEIFGVEPPDIAGAIEETEQPSSRGVVYDLGGITIVDDSYNSNPASLKSAVESFVDMPVEGKRWLVLGDMLELGQQSKDLHSEMGVICGKAGVDGLITLGTESVELNRQASVQRKAPPVISHFIDAAKLAGYLNEYLQPGDAVLIKGSRGMRMEKVLEELEHLREVSPERID